MIEGRVQITLGGKVIILKAGDPSVHIPSRVIHSIQGFKGERLVLREQADPDGVHKIM